MHCGGNGTETGKTVCPFKRETGSYGRNIG